MEKTNSNTGVKVIIILSIIVFVLLVLTVLFATGVFGNIKDLFKNQTVNITKTEKEVTVTAKEARKDKDGKRVKEVVDGKKVTVYDEVEKTVKKDMPSRLHARREMLKVLYPVSEIPENAEGKKKATRKVDLTEKLFDEYATKYADRKGGYTRIVKIAERKGDGALEVFLELV